MQRKTNHVRQLPQSLFKSSCCICSSCQAKARFDNNWTYSNQVPALAVWKYTEETPGKSWKCWTTLPDSKVARSKTLLILRIILCYMRLILVDFCLYHNFYLLSNRQCKKAHNEKCIFFPLCYWFTSWASFNTPNHFLANCTCWWLFDAILSVESCAGDSSHVSCFWALCGTGSFDSVKT